MAGNFTKALVEVPPGKNLIGAASELSWKEWCELWGKANGKTCRFEESNPRELEEALPGGLGKELADMFRYIGDFGYFGRDPAVVWPKDVSCPRRNATVDVRPLLTRFIQLGVEIPVTTIEEYMQREDWSEVL